MLRVSKLTDYGTVIMAYLARHPGQPYAAAEVAGALGVSLPTVSKVLKKLTRGGLLCATRGAKGGYSLSRPAAAISLTQIIDAMEGPIGLTECGAIPGLCAQEPDCALRVNWRRVSRLVLKALDGVTLADMVAPQLQSVRLALSRPISTAR